MSEPATRSQADPMFRNSFRLTVIYGAVGAVLATEIGHAQGQHMVAAAEALWERMTWSASQSSPLSARRHADEHRGQSQSEETGGARVRTGFDRHRHRTRVGK